MGVSIIDLRLMEKRASERVKLDAKISKVLVAQVSVAIEAEIDKVN